MASPNNDDAITLGPRRFTPALRFGFVLLMAAWISSAALAAESASPPASVPGNAGPPGQSGRALDDDASEPLAQELAGARREVELLQHLSQAHERAERLDQDLASARRALDAQAALTAKAKDEAARIEKASEAVAADLRQAAQKERERAEALAAALTKIRLELYANQALAAKATDEAAELRRQIASSGSTRQPAPEDKDRITTLERDLAAARREIDERTTLLAKLRDEAAQLKNVSEAGSANLKQAAQKERERADTLAGELAKVRGDLQANRMQTTKAADEAAEFQREIAAAATARQSMAAEKERAMRLERDLGAARRDLDAQVVLAAKSRNDAERLREASERDLASLREQVRLERSRAEALERDLAAGPRKDLPKDLPSKGTSKVAATTGAVSPSVQGVPIAVAPVAGVAAAVEPAPDRPTPEMAAASVGLVARASSLLGQGDIIAARTVLERAAMMGNAQASFALAETYDPSVLAKWGTYGTRGDPAMARDLYAKAVAGGIKEAKERVEALRR
ncbi:MAG: hypothetical protein JWR89_759 [Tardiphaga sp.]|nr:hypothetical protein [Tardiphaga sp.]